MQKPNNIYQFALIWLMLSLCACILFILMFCPKLWPYIGYNIFLSPAYYLVLLILSFWYKLGKSKLNLSIPLLILWLLIPILLIGVYLDEFRGEFKLFSFDFENYSFKKYIKTECQELFKFSSLLLSSMMMIIIDNK